MIHPQFWSLHSLWHHVFYNQERDAVSYCKYLDVKDKVVLDVGSGDFGTAREFLKHGARYVICIERDYYPIPKDLAEAHRRHKIVIFNEPFDPVPHLSFEYDVAKFDIEGYEILLIPYFPFLKRAIAEVHSEYLVDAFLSHNWRIYKRTDVAGEHCLQVLMVNDHE